MVVDQLRVLTLVALEGLGLMVEVHASAVWEALLRLSGASTTYNLSCVHLILI